MRPRWLPAALVALLLAACDGQRSAAPPAVDPDATPLRLCLEDNDPPRSQQEPEGGFDLELMAAAAARAGRRFEVVWIPSSPKIIELEESTFPVRTLRRGDCNALASIPGAAALGEDADELVLSRPYYAAGFELIAPEEIAPKLEALRGRPVSVLSVSVAHVVAEIYGMDWLAAVTAENQRKAVDAGAVEAALVFGPSLAGLGLSRRADFEIPEALRWNFHLATSRNGDPELAAAMDRALGELIEDGRVDALLERYDIPIHAPYASASTRASLRAMRESVAARD